MRNKFTLLLLLGLSVFLQCCGGGGDNAKIAPACDDDRSISMVCQITAEYIEEIRGPGGLEGITVDLNNISTRKSDPDTGTQQCSGVLVFTGPRGANKLNISYTTELIPNEKDRFRVTVDGL